MRWRRLSPKVFRLKGNVLEASNEKTKKFYRNPYSYISLLIITHNRANFVGKGSWPANPWKGLKVESMLKI